MFSCLSWGVKVRSRQSGPGLKLSIKPSIKSSELVTTRSHVTNRFKWVPASSNRQIPTATVSPLRDGILSNTFQWGLFHHCRYSLMLVSYAINIQRALSLGLYIYGKFTTLRWKSLVKTVWNWVICQTFVILSERFQREEQSSQQDWQFSLRFVFNSVRGPLLILSCEDLSFNLNLLIVSVWNFLFSHQDKFSVLSRATATKTEDIQRRK